MFSEARMDYLHFNNLRLDHVDQSVQIYVSVVAIKVEKDKFCRC